MIKEELTFQEKMQWQNNQNKDRINANIKFAEKRGRHRVKAWAPLFITNLKLSLIQCFILN